MSTYLLGILASSAIFIFTISVMRRGLIKERFAYVWILTSGIMLFFAVFNNTLVWVSRSLTFKTPSNLLFFAGIVLIIIILVQYSYELGKLESQNRKMAIEIALIKNELKRESE